VFAVAQHDPRREWLAARTEVLINHLRACERQPPAVRQKAEDHKQLAAARSPKKPAPRHDFGDGGTSIESVSPYTRPPVLQVQTPSESYQSAYTLTVPAPSSQLGSSNHIQYGQAPPSLISSSCSSLAPSDSISLRSSLPPRASRRGKNRVAPHSAPPDVTWTDAHQLRFEERLMRLTASAGLPLSWVENPEWLTFCTEFIPSAKSPSRKVLTSDLQTLRFRQKPLGLAT
jgi:hypothetical protein